MDLDARLKEFRSRPGLLIVVSGPSGVGKDTLLEHLGKVCPGIRRAVTYTTREPRPNEVAGRDYKFVSESAFRQMIGNGELLEYAEVHGRLYGSPLAETRAIRESGLDAILKIDVQGGLAVKQKAPEAVMVFVAPPSMEELERRLRARYTDSEADIQRRCRDAVKEIAQIPRYEYLIVNDDINTAVDELRAVIMAERIRIRANGD